MKKVITLKRKRFYQDDEGQWIPFIQQKRVRVYGETHNQLNQEKERKQKLYVMGEL